MTQPTKILVVDDSKVSRIMSMGLLRKLLPESQLLEAASAEEARAILAAEGPQWMLLDHNMPGITGLDLAEQVLPLHPGLRVALLTANIQEATQTRAASLGVAFFRKPIGETVLKGIIEQLSSPPKGVAA